MPTMHDAMAGWVGDQLGVKVGSRDDPAPLASPRRRLALSNTPRAARKRQRGSGPSGRRGPVDYPALIRMALAEGCRYQPGTGKHPKLVLPCGRTVSIPATTSDHRAVRNTTARLRSLGLRLSR